MSTNEILGQCTIEGNVVKLPNIQLDRKDYLDVKNKLEFIGGKWKSGKVQGFVFVSDPINALIAITGETKNLKKEFQFFATPKPIAERLVFLADVQQHDTILEPSAGRGAIVSAINEQCDVVVDCCEILGINRTFLNDSGLRFNVIKPDFLEINKVGYYTKIIANPPFAKNQDIDHLYKMWECLAKGGRIVTIMSEHWRFASGKKEVAFREWLEEKDYEIEELEAGDFKESGTNIKACILILNR